MKNAFKIVVLGSPMVGKTTLIEEAIYGNQHYRLQQQQQHGGGQLNKFYEPTIEDIYCAMVEVEKNLVEKIFLYDYSGEVSMNPDSIKMYLSFCDAFLIVFSITDENSYQLAVQMKKIIEKFKDKKDIPIIMLANKMDLLKDSQLNLDDIRKWCTMEKIKLMETSAINRKSINDCLINLVSKLISLSKSSSSFSRKSKTGSLQLEL